MSDYSGSQESSTLSEFVRRRWQGEVSVFGGSPARGVRELASAAQGSVSNSEFVDAVNGLTTVLQRMSGGGQLSRRGSEAQSPIILMDKTHPEFYNAGKLDDDKVKMLLGASHIRPDDFQHYYNLLVTARDGIRKKSTSMELQEKRKKARVRQDAVMPLSEYQQEQAEDLYQSLSNMLGLRFNDNKSRLMLLAACTHDSVTGGRETNRGYALLGDALLKAMLYKECVALGVRSGDASAMWAWSQSNVRFRQLGVDAGLSDYIVAAKGVDVASQGVMADVVEAICAVIYLDGGEEAVHDVCKQMDVLELSALRAKVKRGSNASSSE